MASLILAFPPIPSSRPATRTLDLAGALLLAFCPGLLLPAATAAPVLCTTTLEAAMEGLDESRQAVSPLVEVTRCGPVTTAPQVMEDRFYSYSAPHARAIDLTHQLTDLFGIAMGGGDGTKVMGFGFIEQTMTWDGSAIENTTNVMLEDQHNLTPMRTGDLPSLFSTSVGDLPSMQGQGMEGIPNSPRSWLPVVRGLW